MKILVTGDRDWNRVQPIMNAFDQLLEVYDLEPADVIVVHGAATGADDLAGTLAKGMGMKVLPYPAHWRHTEDCPSDCRKMVGRPAGPIRNKQMLDENPDIELALAFHPDLDNSKGTKNMLGKLEKKDIPYIHFV